MLSILLDKHFINKELSHFPGHIPLLGVVVQRVVVVAPGPVVVVIQKPSVGGMPGGKKRLWLFGEVAHLRTA